MMALQGVEKDSVSLWPVSPLHRCDPSWLEHWLGDSSETFSWSWRKSSSLNQWVNQQLTKWTTTDWDWLASASGKFWKQPPQYIRLYLTYIGAVFCHQQFNRLVLKSDIDQCKTVLDDNLLQYCRHQVSLLLSEWPSHWHREVPIDQLASNLCQLGLDVLLCQQGSPIPSSAQERIQTWFPRDWQISFYPADFIHASEHQRFNTLMSKVHKHLDPLCSRSLN